MLLYFISVRNAILDQKRKAEEEVRERLTEAYNTEKERWELMEKRRLRELDRNKKDCRKINLKFDSFMEIVGRTQREYEQLEVIIFYFYLLNYEYVHCGPVTLLQLLLSCILTFPYTLLFNSG